MIKVVRCGYSCRSFRRKERLKECDGSVRKYMHWIWKKQCSLLVRCSTSDECHSTSRIASYKKLIVMRSLPPPFTSVIEAMVLEAKLCCTTTWKWARIAVYTTQRGTEHSCTAALTFFFWRPPARSFRRPRLDGNLKKKGFPYDTNHSQKTLL